DFSLGADRPKILDAVDPIGAAQGALQGSGIFQVSLDNFDALMGQFLSRSVAGVSRQCPELPSFGQHMADNGSALPSGGASDQHGLVRIAHGEVSLLRMAKPAHE